MKQDVHLRSAKRMLEVCRANTGVYTKAGQHIASLTYIVPKQYTETLGVLTDKAPFMAFADVDKVLKKELGQNWRDYFAEFDEVCGCLNSFFSSFFIFFFIGSTCCSQFGSSPLWEVA